MNNISQIWAQPAQQDFGRPQPARPAKFRCKIPSTFDECQKDAAFHGLWPVKRALFQGFYQTSGEYLSSPLLRTPTKWSIDLKNCSLFHPADIHSDLFFVVKYKTRMTMFIVQLNWHHADAQLNMEKKICIWNLWNESSTWSTRGWRHSEAQWGRQLTGWAGDLW